MLHLRCNIYANFSMFSGIEEEGGIVKEFEMVASAASRDQADIHDLDASGCYEQEIFFCIDIDNCRLNWGRETLKASVTALSPEKEKVQTWSYWRESLKT